jgi:uncharacterized spore protein YtfJ
MIVQDVLKQMAEDIKRFTKTETIFGDPIEVQGNIIIPICKVAIGYGGGGGEGEGPESKVNGKGAGAGGGAGLKIEPAALIVAKDGKISIVPIGGRESKVGSLLEKIPDVFERMKAAKTKGSKSEESHESN